MHIGRVLVAVGLVSSYLGVTARSEEAAGRFEYKLLATSKTSTMEKELNEAADAGFRFEGVMGGETSFGGKEVVSILSRVTGAQAKARYQYKLLATNRTGTMQKEMAEAAVAEYKLLATSKTSTMQKELSEVAEAGYRYRGVTVAKTSMGGNEVVVITERPIGAR